MNIKKIGIVLWIGVLVYGSFYIYQRLNLKPVVRLDDSGMAAILDPDHDGRVFVDVPWKRLPQIEPFELTERSGEDFDSRSLAGKPYVLSFFFTNCPTICRDLNRQIGVLANRHKNTETTFIGMSVDTKNDTPEVLRAYAEDFNADPEKWLMLTGQQFKINELARQQLLTVVDGEHHTGDIFLVDRWGRFRDRFSWDDPREMKRFDSVLEEVLAETSPPLDKTVKTRNVAATFSHTKQNQPSAHPWLRDFQLTDSRGKDFYSRDLTGQVWVGSFFFSRCGSVCPKQNAWLAKIQPELAGRKVKTVSITTDPDYDQPEILRPYARDLNATDDEWLFLTGDDNYIQRIGSEFLGIPVHGEHHSSLLAVVDRWGNVRGHMDWQAENGKEKLLNLVDQLNQETQPPAEFELIKMEMNDE